MQNPFRYFNSSPEIIRLAVMMYVRFPQSLRWPPGFGRHGRASVIPGFDDCDRQRCRPDLRSLAQ